MATLYLSSDSETNFLSRHISAHPGKFKIDYAENVIFEGDDGWNFLFEGDFNESVLKYSGPEFVYDDVDKLEVYDHEGNIQYMIENGSFSLMSFNGSMNENPLPSLFLNHIVLFGNDEIIGTSADEIFEDSKGEDYYNLGGGVDTIIYESYSFRNAQVDIDPETGTALLSTPSFEGKETDTLVNVERIMHENDAGFDIISLDLEGLSAQTYRMYQAALGRIPDEPGLGYWIDQMQNGLGIEAMADGFISSNEFKELFGSDQSDDSFVASIYENVLGRAPDQAGLNWWVEQLENGNYNRSSVLVGFCESPENVELVMPDIENGIHYDLWMG